MRSLLLAALFLSSIANATNVANQASTPPPQQKQETENSKKIATEGARPGFRCEWHYESGVGYFWFCAYH
jgi:hypothetical protein